MLFKTTIHKQFIGHKNGIEQFVEKKTYYLFSIRLFSTSMKLLAI